MGPARSGSRHRLHGFVRFEAIAVKRNEIWRMCDEERLRFTLENLTLGEPTPNACFYRRRIFERFGVFDLEYKVATDRDFLVRVALTGVRHAAIGSVGYWYRAYGGSLTIRKSGGGNREAAREFLAIARKLLVSDCSHRALIRRWHCERRCRKP